MAAKTDAPVDGIDWSLTTWEGARREQLRRWSEMPLEEQIRAVESGLELMEHLRDFGHAQAGNRAKKP
jgi:hypothetical protein